MQNFIIQPNQFFKTGNSSILSLQLFWWCLTMAVEGTVENIICTLKNDITPFSEIALQGAIQYLNNILSTDLPEILHVAKLNSLTVCTVPRAKLIISQTNYYLKLLLVML